MSEPRLLVRRDGDCVLVAQDASLAGYARRLGEIADQLADEDPLVAPTRVVERFREIGSPAEANLSDARLVRLASAVSQHAALSSRQELYPRGMPAARAVRLSQGALGGPRMLTVAQVRERVAGRYPEAAPLPDRPALDDLLREAGFDFRWEEAGKDGAGCYVSNLRDVASVTSGSATFYDGHTSDVQYAAGEITPELAEKRAFEEKLERGLKEGAFLALTVPMRGYQAAIDKLTRKFPLELVDFEGLFLDALMAVAGKAAVNWDLVLKTDAAPHAGDWDKLMILVGRAMPAVEERLLKAESTMLLIYPGLLARYDQMDLLTRLSQKVGRRDGIPGLWILLPGDQLALIDGRAVPLLDPGQRARIPESWLSNPHREDGEGLTQSRKDAKEKAGG